MSDEFLAFFECKCRSLFEKTFYNHHIHLTKMFPGFFIDFQMAKGKGIKTTKKSMLGAANDIFNCFSYVTKGPCANQKRSPFGFFLNILKGFHHKEILLYKFPRNKQ